MEQVRLAENEYQLRLNLAFQCSELELNDHADDVQLLERILSACLKLAATTEEVDYL